MDRAADEPPGRAGRVERTTYYSAVSVSLGWRRLVSALWGVLLGFGVVGIGRLIFAYDTGVPAGMHGSVLKYLVAGMFFGIPIGLVVLASRKGLQPCAPWWVYAAAGSLGAFGLPYGLAGTGGPGLLPTLAIAPAVGLAWSELVQSALFRTARRF